MSIVIVSLGNFLLLITLSFFKVQGRDDNDDGKYENDDKDNDDGGDGDDSDNNE